VESMIRDLVRIAVELVKQEKIKEIEAKALANVEEKLLDLLLPHNRRRENNSTPEDPKEFQKPGKD